MVSRGSLVAWFLLPAGILGVLTMLLLDLDSTREFRTRCRSRGVSHDVLLVHPYGLWLAVTTAVFLVLSIASAIGLSWVACKRGKRLRAAVVLVAVAVLCADILGLVITSNIIA